MAVMLPTKSSGQHFSISNIISRFRSKKGSSPKSRGRETNPGIVQESRPSLILAPLPLVLPEHQQTLPTLGWTTVTFPDSAGLDAPSPGSISQSQPAVHPLQQAYEDLFAASQTFFDLPDDEKRKWKHKLGSEEGWSRIPGEKEFIALRTLEYCPDILKEPAKRYWDLMGAHLSNTLGRISTAIGLPDGENEGLRRFVGPCGSMQSTEDAKTATMIRLFRYEGWEAKEVAEPHADLGLLSIVVGNVPGLEVWDGFTWFDCEREVQRAGKKGATMLSGRQLELLSNGRYPAGGHRVVSYGAPKPNPKPANEESPSATEKKYRFSIVFVLRAHEPIIIDSDELETEVTGKWAEPTKGVTAGQNYEDIRIRHFNINIAVNEREKQRRKVKALKGMAG